MVDKKHQTANKNTFPEQTTKRLKKLYTIFLKIGKTQL